MYGKKKKNALASLCNLKCNLKRNQKALAAAVNYFFQQVDIVFIYISAR
jgi:hypothetical protein